MVKADQLRRGARKALPFDGSHVSEKRLPKQWGPKQRTWILAGLKHLKAPIVPRYYSEDSFCFEDNAQNPKRSQKVFCSKHVYVLRDFIRQEFLLGFWAISQVFATVISLLFQVQDLDFTKPDDHVELFAGEMSVTKGEINDFWLAFILYRLSKSLDLASTNSYRHPYGASWSSPPK